VLEALSTEPAFFVGSCLLLGLIVGSFLNVVIHRVPIMLDRQWRDECAAITGSGTGGGAPAPRFNLLVPRSECPSCRAPITALQNIPLVSYLALRGRCAACGVRISARYPLIEALTGLASAAVAWKFGFGWPALGALVLTWFLIALACIDLDRQLLPDNLTLPLLWLGLAASLAAPLAGHPAVPVDTRSSIIGALAGYLSLWSVYHVFRLVTGKEGMGYGDFKLLAALGAWLGWQLLLPIILTSALVGAVVGISVLALLGRDRSTPIPFGPFLAAAGWLVLMYGHELVERYLGLFGPHP